MKFLSTLLVLGGYLLVYASIANHGRIATQPWMGLFVNAYAQTAADKKAANDAIPPGKKSAGSAGGGFSIWSFLGDL